MAAPKQRALEYWLLKIPAATDRPQATLLIGEPVKWPISSNARRIGAGDVAFLWDGSGDGGLHGWGWVRSLSKSGTAAMVEPDTVFPERITTKEALAVKDLADLVFQLGNPSVIELAVSTLQASAFARLMRARGFDAPPVDIGRVRAGALRRLQNFVFSDDRLRQLTGVQALVADLRGMLESGNVEEGSLEYLLRILAEQIRKDQPTDPRGAVLRGQLIDEIETILQKELELPAAAPLPVVEAEVARPRAKPAEDVPPFLRDIVGAQPAAADAFTAAVPSFTAPADVPSPQPAQTEAAPPPPPPQQPPPQAPEEIEVPAGRGITRWWDEDRANITGDVRNLSRYIAAVSLQPPQAIGIFGDWGSGKTFFMNAVRSEVANIAWQSERSPTGSAFCSQVVQIEFNAWHYVESNLWASLATHIFGSLHRSLSARSNAKEDVNKLFQSLETAKAAVEAAEMERQAKAAMVEKLKEQRAAAEKEVVESSDRVLEEREALEDLAKEKILAALHGETDKNVAKLQTLVGKDRIEKAAVAGRDVVALAREAQSLLTPLWLALKESPWNVVLALLTAAALIAVPAGVGWLSEKLFATQTVSQAGAVVGTLLSMLTAIAAWLKANGQKLLNAARQVQQLRADAAKAAEEKMRKPIADAEAKLAAGQQALAAVSESLEKEKARLAEAEGAVRGEDIVVRMRQFLEERVRNKTYEQHLGLVTLIRKDFETLSDIMAAARERSKDLADFDVKGTTRQVPVVERIVLYIDDLDRCPHDKVVDVLQAVHLLLGFKLFVVLVGVDVRWVGKALLKQYPELLAGGNGQGAGVATSDDYLEKIFQIPFRIAPMNSTARESFVTGLVGTKAPAKAAAGPLKVPPQPLNPREFQLNKQETDAIIELRNCLGRSPRRLKRFVDIYRLMRAGMPDAEVEGLMDKQQYVGILGVFAMMTALGNSGTPMVEAFFADLPNLRAGRTFEQWLAANWSKSAGYGPALRVMKYFDQKAGGDNGLLVDGLGSWSDRIGRYTFHEIRLDS